MLHDLPHWLDEESWLAYVEMRRLMGKQSPFTERAERMVIKRLEDFYRQGYDVTYILEDAVIGSWKSVYINNRTPMRSLSTAEKSNVSKITDLCSAAVRKA